MRLKKSCHVIFRLAAPKNHDSYFEVGGCIFPCCKIIFLGNWWLGAFAALRSQNSKRCSQPDHFQNSKPIFNGFSLRLMILNHFIRIEVFDENLINENLVFKICVSNFWFFEFTKYFVWSSFNHCLILAQSSFDPCSIIFRSSFDHRLFLVWSLFDPHFILF